MRCECANEVRAASHALLEFCPLALICFTLVFELSIVKYLFAAILKHLLSPSTNHTVSLLSPYPGLRVDQIQECILWMTPFALAIRDEGFDLLRLRKNELIQKTPHMQLHTVDLKLLVSGLVHPHDYSRYLLILAVAYLCL